MSFAEDRIGPRVLKDLDLQRELDLLETDEDRQDFLDALKALDEVEREGTISWESLKSDLGL
jgi:ribosome assembly protein YihI (activator of Der GTPase)